MATLYQLTDAWQEVLDMAADDEAPQDAIDARLDAIAEDIRTKAEGYCKVIGELNAQAAALRAEEDRLKKRRQSVENNAARLKDALQEAMTTMEAPKIKTALFTVSLRSNPEKLQLDDVDAFMAWAEQSAPELLKITRTVNNAAVRKALKSGAAVPGASLVSTQGISIR